MRHRLFVDSRDCVSNLTSFSFTVYLSDPFRETSIGVARFERVKSVELKALAFPKTGDEYVIMDIAELNDERLHSSNQTANRRRDNTVITPADAGNVNRCSFMLEITTLV